MAERVAFLIGTQTFRPDSGLLPLRGPANDIAALARLLHDPERGQFKVHEFLDKPSYEILPNISEALNVAAPDDLFLIYYSGHGKLDRSGRLCLATVDTRHGALLATSIPALNLRNLVEESDCTQVVLLLDCCYSGAVEDGLRGGDLDSQLHVIENARGFYILTATSDMQTAKETELVFADVVMGRFTAALVDGIESGDADPGRKGQILLSDLRRYLEKVVKGQTPQFFARKASGDPIISFSPATAAPLLELLDARVLADLDAEEWHRRHGAVSALSLVIRIGDAATRLAAKAALRHRLGQERDYVVRAEIEAALALGGISGESPDKEKAGEQPLDDALRLESTGHFKEAAHAYKKAADQGNLDALTNLGRLYRIGRGVERSYLEAANCFQRAADQGNAIAQSSLARLYREGWGVPQSDLEAVRLYRLAAEQGNAIAQFNLGDCYEKARGVPKSRTEAIKWYRMAARQEMPLSQTALRRLGESW
jgi:TPR repeat protein